VPFQPRYSITNAATRDLAKIERARGFLEGATLSEDWIRRMGQRALLLEAHHTTHIEGTHLTVDQAARLWKGDEVADVDPDDRRELLNYRNAFDLVASSLAAGEPITETLIRAIHAELVTGVRGGEGEPGAYRMVQNQVVNSVTGQVIYTPPPQHDVAPLMQEFVDWLRAPADIHPVLVAGIAQFQLVHIHPFVDGNGRTSRLLSTLVLYQAGYDFKRLFTISEYYDRDRAAFYSALQQVRNTGMDLTGWIEYFTCGLATQLVEVQHRGITAVTAERLGQAHGLSPRQVALLDEIIAVGSAGADSLLTAFFTVSRRTLQRDLAALLDAGLIASIGDRTDPTRRYQAIAGQL
jgi:cell filamentation protein, protein adenylyltransferase